MRLPVHIWIREENAGAGEVAGYFLELARRMDERPQKLRLAIHSTVPAALDFDPKDGNPSVTVGGETLKFGMRHRWIPEHPVPLEIGSAGHSCVTLLVDPVDGNRFRVRERRELSVPGWAYAMAAIAATVAAITLHPAAVAATAMFLTLILGRRLAAARATLKRVGVSSACCTRTSAPASSGLPHQEAPSPHA